MGLPVTINLCFQAGSDLIMLELKRILDPSSYYARA